MNKININLDENGILTVNSELGEGFTQDLNSDITISGEKIFKCLEIKDKLETFILDSNSVSTFVYDYNEHSTNLNIYYDQIKNIFKDLSTFLTKNATSSYTENSNEKEQLVTEDGNLRID